MTLDSTAAGSVLVLTSLLQDFQMLIKPVRTAVAATLLILAGAAQAEVITFRFTGTVTATLDAATAPVGSQVEGTFSYDPDTVAAIELPGYAEYQPTAFMSGSVNGHPVTSDGLRVSVQDDFGGNVEDMVVLSGHPVMVGDALHIDGSFGLSLASHAGNTDVLHGTGLPTIYHLADFDSNVYGQQVTYGWLQKDGSQTGTIAYFRIDSITGGYESCRNPQGKPKKCSNPKAGR